ncbi:MAG: DUF6519 domain-containing protein [Rhodoplanes sp.]
MSHAFENQLYRVEIHDPGQPGGGATFKWSRENASVGSRVARMISGTELELQTLGRDDVLRFSTGDWVEITDDLREFSRLPGEIRRVTVIDATRRIQFTPALPAAMLPAASPTARSRSPAICAFGAGTRAEKYSAPIRAARRSRSRTWIMPARPA